MPNTHLQDPTSDLDTTIAGLDSGVTSLTPTAALASIDRWQAACADADLPEVAEGLSELHDLLSADRLDGRAIAATLGRLGTATTAAAGTDERVGPRLERLGAALTRAASALGG